MNLAVEHGAEVGKSFVSYVEYLENKNFIPPNGKKWVDYIRTQGNEANHEISIKQKEEAKNTLIFVEMLLKICYEFPSLIPE